MDVAIIIGISFIICTGIVCYTVFKCFKISVMYPSKYRTINELIEDVKQDRFFHKYKYKQIEGITEEEDAS